MGVRHVVSTWSLLAGKPAKMRSYDLFRSPNVAGVERVTREADIDFSFFK
jgi:hypothetical protein